MISSVQESFILSYIMWGYDCDYDMCHTSVTPCNITLNPNPKFPIKWK